MHNTRSPNRPLVSVVVEGTTDRHGRVMHRTLDSLAAQTYPHSRIEVVFMDASPDGRVGRRVADLWPQAVIVPAAGLQYYAIKNLGAERASGDIVAFVDSDVTWNNEWIDQAVEGLASMPPYSALVGLTRYAPGYLSDAGTVSQFGHHWYKFATRDFDGLLGVIANNFAIRRRDFLDVRYRFTSFRQGMDMLLANDLQARGGVIRLNPRMRGTHKWGWSKLWEQPQTGYNVGRGLTTVLAHCNWHRREGGPLDSHLSQVKVPVNVDWLLSGSRLSTVGLAAARFGVFYTYLRGTRRVLEVKPYRLFGDTVFLAGFFGLVAAGALSHRHPEVEDRLSTGLNAKTPQRRASVAGQPAESPRSGG